MSLIVLIVFENIAHCLTASKRKLLRMLRVILPTSRLSEYICHLMSVECLIMTYTSEPIAPKKTHLKRSAPPVISEGSDNDVNEL